MQYPRLLSLASFTAPCCSLASPRATFSRSLGVLSTYPAKVLRSVHCVNNQRQQTLSPLHLQRQFYVSTNFGQNDNGPTVKASRPLEEWSAQEIQSWLQQEDLACFAPAFAQLNGKRVSQLTKDDLQKEFGSLGGSVIYHAIQELKDDSSFIVERTFQKLAEQNPSLDFEGAPRPPEHITEMEFDFMDREYEVEQLTEAFCDDFVGFFLQSAHKKHKLLIAITGGSGVGKTRLSITMLNHVRAQLTQNAPRYLSYLSKILLARAASVTAQEVYEALLAGLEDASKAHTFYLDFSNGDYFSDWNNPENIERAFLFSLVAKGFFPRAPVGAIRGCLDGTNFDRCTTFLAVVSALRQRFGVGVGTKDRLTIILNIDEFQTKITEEDIVLLRTNPKNKDRILIRRIADCIMSTCLKLAAWNIHVVPVFSGTLSLADIGVFPATHYALRSLPIGPLSLEASQEIVRSALNRDDIPNSLIGTVGGVARGLQFLVAAIRSQPNNSACSYEDIFKATVKTIGDMYSIDNHVLSPNGVRTLVRLCLSGKEVKKTEAVDGVPLNILERDGLLFLKPSQPQLHLYQVIMPLAFAAALNNRLILFDPNFVTYRPVVKSSDLEKFARDFEVFENNLLLDLGIKETTFGERFSGALMSDTLKHRPIVLSYMTAYNSKEEQLPKVGAAVPVVERRNPVDLYKESVSLWIGRNWPASDNIYTFPGQENGKTFVCLNELKSTIVWQKAKSAGVMPGEIYIEKRATEQAQDFFPTQKFELFFYFLSNTRLPTPINTLNQGILADNHTIIVRYALFTLLHFDSN
ncbi:hypothetical protein QOT17_001848 [Balamuthia mandrillaris]